MVVWENASRPAHLFLRFPFYSYSVWALVCFLDNMYMPKSLTAFYLQYISDFPLTLWAILILQTRVFCQRHESLRVLHSIFAVPRTVLYWTEISDVVCGIWWNHSPLALLRLYIFLFSDVAMIRYNYICHYDLLPLLVDYYYAHLVSHHQLDHLDLDPSASRSPTGSSFSTSLVGCHFTYSHTQSLDV